MNLLHSIAAQRRRVPTISGTAFPGETLTSTSAGQWTADGVPISGETGATYVVGLDKIGAVIRCGGSNPLTIWHPNTIPNVIAAFLSNFNVLNSVSPDVPATDGQSVRNWVDVVNGYQYGQTAGVSQPIFDTDTPRLNFDGSNDQLTQMDDAIRNFSRNVNNAQVYAIVRDTNRAGGTSLHPIIGANTSSSVALFLLTQSNLSGWACSGRRVNGETFKSVAAASSDGWHVIGGEHLYSAGTLNLRVDGSQAATTSFTASGASDSTSLAATRIGSDGLVTPLNFFPGDIAGVVFTRGSTALTATQRSQIERYLGLFGGLNIPLV
jgi:hypothetical protein